MRLFKVMSLTYSGFKIPLNPISKKTIFELKKSYTDAAILLLQDTLKRTPTHNSQAIDILKTMLEEFIYRSSEFDKISDTKDLSPDLIAHYFTPHEKIWIQEKLTETFKKAGIPIDIKMAFKFYLVTLLNKHRKWQPIHLLIKQKYNGEELQFQSRLIPGNRYFDANFSIYQESGCSSQGSAESIRPINFWLSQFMDLSGQILFEGFRHGIHSAHGIADVEERIKANESRAKESIKAAIIRQITRKNMWESAKKGETIPLNITSISLLTPDNIRYMKSRGKISSENERLMLSEQMTAWKKVQDAYNHQKEPIMIETPEGNTLSVSIQLTIYPFNFGVNDIALTPKIRDFNSFIKRLTKPAQGRDFEYPYNKIAIKKLILDSQSYVNLYLKSLTSEIQKLQSRTPLLPLEKVQLDQLISKKRLILSLKQQILKIWKKKAYTKEGEEPYKMPVRLALISYLTDQTVFWNCKSGKDRTGQLDAEIKFLVARLTMENKVPDYDCILNQEERQNFKAMIMNSGNHEVQKLNTGGPGYKIRNIPALKNRIGPNGYLQQIGISQYLKS